MNSHPTLEKPANLSLLAVGSTKFARNGAALVETLFDASGTASGLFRIRKNGVLFMAPDGTPFAFLVANRHGETFFVSASRQSDGRISYMFTISDADAVRLGISSLGYSARSDEAARVWAVVNAR